MTGKPEILRTITSHSGWTRLLVASIRMPDGRLIKREIEHHGAAACVLPYHPERRTAVLVRQFRAPVLYASGEPDTLEAIAGILDESDPAECVRREAGEEAGLMLGEVEHVCTGWTMPGVSTEQMHFFLATYSGVPRHGFGGAPDEDEHILPVEIGLKELADRADKGAVSDVKTLLLIQTLRLRKPELFRGEL